MTVGEVGHSTDIRVSEVVLSDPAVIIPLECQGTAPVDKGGQGLDGKSSGPRHLESSGPAASIGHGTDIRLSELVPSDPSCAVITPCSSAAYETRTRQDVSNGCINAARADAHP